MTRASSPFGERLRRHREAAALTQEELAERAGLTAQAVGALETGKRRRPYPATVRALADALALPEPERAELAALASGRDRAPAQPAATDLPAPPTPLIGRDRELEALPGLLVDEQVRLVTLIGPGGVGKTHLALGVAARGAGRFPDGVAFVPLAPLADAALVLPTIARTLGLREASGQSAEAAVAAHLRDRRLLLVLDNAEHVLDVAPDVASLLAACPALTVLVTSRAPLRIRGEREFPVPPLAVPDLSHVPAAEEVVASPAAHLFAERAREADPAFAVTGANAAAVAAICRRLDGLPLALELAAPWVKLLPPTALLARLDRTLPLLEDGARDLPARQQTMRDTIAWSYDLLDEDDRRLFRRLAIFVGGFTLDAAEEVCAALGAPASEVLGGLARLVDRSLLRREGGSEPRFAMLETIREFGLEQLDASGEASAVRGAHAAWATDLAVQAGATLDRRMEPGTFRRVDAELDNLRAALAWLQASRRTDDVLRLAGAMLFPWYLSGNLREGRTWAERALAEAPDEPTLERGAAALTAGHHAHYLGDDEAAVAWLREAAGIARHVGDAWREAFSTMMLGIVAEDDGRYAEAAALFSTARERFVASDDGRGKALAAFHLGIVAYGEGDPERSLALQEGALAESRALGDPLIEAWCLEWLGVLATERGALGEAAVVLGERMAIGIGSQSMPRDGQLMATVAVLGAAGGADVPAARLMGATEALLAESGDSFHLPERDVYERAAARLRTTLGETRYGELAAVGRTMPDDAITADIEAILATAGRTG
jgi:predicted ATPase/DNA-binding XRE family transcriptional regulator